MFIDPDLRAMIAARFEFVGTEITPGIPDTMAGRAAARSSALRELIRLVYDQVKSLLKVPRRSCPRWRWS